MINMYKVVIILLVICFCSVLLAAERGEKAESLLLAAVRTGGEEQVQVVSRLLDSGVDIGATDSDGMTALHLAARYNNDPRIIELLLAYGADAGAVAGELPEESEDGLRGTPLYYALCYNTNYRVIDILLSMQPVDGYSVYSLAACAAHNPNTEITEKFYMNIIDELLPESEEDSNVAGEGGGGVEAVSINAAYDWGSEDMSCQMVSEGN